MSPTTNPKMMKYEEDEDRKRDEKRNCYRSLSEEEKEKKSKTEWYHHRSLSNDKKRKAYRISSKLLPKKN